MNKSQSLKLILVELNEITWRLLEPLVKEGALPTFARLIRDGVRATPMAPEVSPDLDPWISWMTAYTGRPASEHGVKFLEQPPETVQGPRIWDLVADAGLPVGIFGSIMSWPPRRDVQGFWIPGTFSPGYETFPENLEPIQELNLTYTREHTPVAGNVRRRMGKLELIWKLRSLGLRTSTLARIAGFFARRTFGAAKDWEKVSLQPLINFDFFESLWQRHRPAFSTFHSNHVAHYQHRYWRSTDPQAFLEPPPADEVRKYGGAIRHGYKIADEMLGRLLAMAGDDAVIVVASGLGQQPYVSKEFREGRTVIRLRDIGQTLDLLGVRDKCEPYSVMAPQWNLRFESDEALRAADRSLTEAYLGHPEQQLFAHTVVGNTISVNIRQKLPRPIDWDAKCVFPASGKTISMRDLCAEKDPTPKQGYHEQAGVLIASGPGVSRGAQIEECSTLDIAPTLLTVLGLPVPPHMSGRVLDAIASDRSASSRQQTTADHGVPSLV